ncbi:MAG: hypothetical protein WCO93_00310 [bacterium]
MKKLIIIALVLIGNTLTLSAQTSDDALRYSRIFYSGTSRFMGLGGAFSAVGADFSTLAINPAGIGLYRSSEFTMTFAPIIVNTGSDYYGSVSSDNKVNFGLGNIGMIFTIKPYSNKSGGLKSFNFGFGMNRQNDFNSQVFIGGFNPTSSMMQSYVDKLNANWIPPNLIRTDYPFDIGLAYDCNLIYQDTTTGDYLCDARNGGVYQSKSINTYGSINEMEISMGGNYNDKLFFGMTIGIPFIRYYQNSVYQERDINGTIPEFNYMNYWYSLQTHGTGVNVKVGLIYQPINWFRVGMSVHTPTWYPYMRDEWFSSMESNFSTSQWNSIQYSPIGNYDYRLTTPFRATAGIAFFLGPYGLLSADYEYVNYSQARFYSSRDNFSTVNQEIQNSFQSWGNLRVGTEWRIQDFRIRGGFAYFSNAYKSGINNNQRFQASGGLGYRGKIFFADVSYVWSMMKEDYYLYDPSLVAPSINTTYTHMVYTTVGIRF